MVQSREAGFQSFNISGLKGLSNYSRRNSTHDSAVTGDHAA